MSSIVETLFRMSGNIESFSFKLLQQTTTEKALATERLAPVILTQKTAGVAPKEVHLHAKSRLHKDLRSELLGEDASKNNTGNLV